MRKIIIIVKRIINVKVKNVDIGWHKSRKITIYNSGRVEESGIKTSSQKDYFEKCQSKFCEDCS